MKTESNHIRILVKKCEIFLREKGYSEASISVHLRKWADSKQKRAVLESAYINIMPVKRKDLGKKILN